MNFPEILAGDFLAEARCCRLEGARVDHSESGEGGNAVYASLLGTFGVLDI